MGEIDVGPTEGETGGPPRAPSGGGSPDAAGTLGEQVEAARREAAENWDRYLRAEADLDNLRRRGRRQTDEALRGQRRDLLLRFLAVADDLERALAHANSDPAAVVAGLEGTYRDLSRLLTQEGVLPVAAADAPFDPSRHEAVGVVPLPGADEERVVSVERSGYLLDGELLRAAQVIVGKPVGTGGGGGGGAGRTGRVDEGHAGLVDDGGPAGAARTDVDGTDRAGWADEGGR